MLQRLDGGNEKELGSFDFLNKHHFVVLPNDYDSHLAYNHGDRAVQSYTLVEHSFCKSSGISGMKVSLACCESHVPPSNTFSPSCSMFNTDFLRIF